MYNELRQSSWFLRDPVTHLRTSQDAPKIVYVIKVEILRLATNTMIMVDNISCGDPELQNTIESPSANLKAVDNDIYWQNSLSMYLYGSKFQVTRDFMKAYSV